MAAVEHLTIERGQQDVGPGTAQGVTFGTNNRSPREDIMTTTLTYQHDTLFDQFEATFA
jgi:hypothetical protein